MKNLSLFNRLALTVAGALALGACNRSEYAPLSRSTSYLGSQPVAVQAAPVAQPELSSAVVHAPAAKPVAATPTAPQPAEKTVLAPQPVEVAAAAPTVAPTLAAPAVPAKLNMVQRLALKSVAKKLNKLTANAPVLKKRDAAAGTARLDGSLRTALVVILISILVGILASIGGTAGTLLAIIASILFIVGIVLLILYLLDQA